MNFISLMIKIIDNDIQYTEKYTNLITEFIIFEEFKKTYLKNNLMSGLVSDNNMIFYPAFILTENFSNKSNTYL